MFTGVNFEQAIDYWKKGREVIVLDRNSQNVSGGYDNFPFEELFRNVELLADVPAVENPEFKQAVAEMVQSGQKQEEPAEEKNSTPPNGAGGERDASGRKDEERDCAAVGRAGNESPGNRKEDRCEIQYGI